MSSESPASELYSSTGVELSVQNGVALPTTPWGLISVGSDGTNSRFIKVDASGNTIVVGLGTAGTPSGGVVSIQGVSGGQVIPVSGTVAVTQSTSPWVSNITQFGSVNISTGAGAGGTGIPRVTVSNDSNILATQSGTWTVQPGNTANTTPWLSTINQGGNSAAVKAASTAAVATDPALVVAISPNNAISGSVTTTSPTYTTGTVNTLSLDTVGNLRVNLTDANTTGTLGALNAAVSLIMTGHAGAGIQLSAGTLIGTIVPEISYDGTTWIGAEFVDPATDLNVASIVFASANTAQSQSITLAGGISNVRVRVSAYTSGTANIVVHASNTVTDTTDFSGSVGSGNFPTNIAFIGGDVTTAAPSYTTSTLNAISLNTTGDLRAISKVTDGTNTATVKAASTAAVATDTALVVALSPNNSITTSSAASYGTSNQTITITLASLASLAQRASTVVDNTSNKFRDTLVQLTIKTGASGTSISGIVNVYAYGTTDGGTTYGEGATGTDASITLTSPPNLKLIGTINAVANATTYKSNPMAVSAAFNGRLPDHWGIVVENKALAALDTTAGNFKVTYQGIN